MSKRKKRQRLGQAEGDWAPFRYGDEDDVNWGLPEQDTPLMEPEPPTCGRCRKQVDESLFAHWSNPDVSLCVKCYNIVAKEHRPPSKR